MQTKEKSHHGVSYRLDLHPKLSMAAENRSPVKLSKVSTKRNLFDPDGTDIVVGSSALLEDIELTEVGFPFEESTNVVDEAPTRSIRDIIDICADKDFITTTVYINISSRPLVTVNTKKGPVLKKDVTVNDSTGFMKLTLWRNDIDQVPQSGVYKIVNARVNEYPTGVHNIQTSFSTTIEPADDDIEPTNAIVSGLVCHDRSLPPESINVDRFFLCPHKKCGCSNKDDGKQIKVFRCQFCGNMILIKNAELQYSASLYFNTCTLSMYHDKVTEYFKQRINIPMPSDVNDIGIAFLTDTNTRVVYNSNFNVIAFK